MQSLAFAFPLPTGKVTEWNDWVKEILEFRRWQYQAFLRRLFLTAHRMYLQHTSQGDMVIVYLEGDNLQHTLQELWTSQDPFAVWFRQRAQELLEGLNLTEYSTETVSRLIFNGPSVEDDEATYQTWEAMEQDGMISP